MDDVIEIPPLRKVKQDGRLYHRRPSTEMILIKFLGASTLVLAQHARITDRRSPDYIPSEVLVHWIRQTRHHKSDAQFNVLYPLLEQRIRHACPTKETSAGGNYAEVGTYADLQEYVLERIVKLLLSDRSSYEEKLDIYEVVFDRAIAKLRDSAFRSVFAKENPLTPLEYDESGDVTSEAEDSLNRYQPGRMTPEEDLTYRFQLRAAIDSLPRDERRLIDMEEAGYPDQSEDPEVHTIAKLLGRTPKTVRAMRKRAYQRIRERLCIEVQDD
jgi:DNA-directed RNA polymerase specialized sigma24 family protein